jgi:hypothetical protein
MINNDLQYIEKFKILYNNFFKDIDKNKFVIKNFNSNINVEFYSNYEIEAMLLRMRFFCFTEEGDYFWANLNNSLKNNFFINKEKSTKSFKELLIKNTFSKKIFVKKGIEDIQEILDKLNITSKKEKNKIKLYKNINHSFKENNFTYHYINTCVDFLELLLYSRFYHFNRTAIIIIESLEIEDVDIDSFLQKILDIFIKQIHFFYYSLNS